MQMRELLRERISETAESLLSTQQCIAQCMRVRKVPKAGGRETYPKGQEGAVPRSHARLGIVPALTYWTVESITQRTLG